MQVGDIGLPQVVDMLRQQFKKPRRLVERRFAHRLLLEQPKRLEYAIDLIVGDSIPRAAQSLRSQNSDKGQSAGAFRPALDAGSAIDWQSSSARGLSNLDEWSKARSQLQNGASEEKQKELLPATWFEAWSGPRWPPIRSESVASHATKLHENILRLKARGFNHPRWGH